MAPLMCMNLRKVLILYLVLFLFSTVLLCASSDNPHQLQSQEMIGRHRRRMLLELEEDTEQKPKPQKIKSPNLATKNQTKLAKSTNSTKSIILGTNLTSKLQPNKLKKLNSTSLLKKLNTTTSTKKTSDLTKLGSPKNKTTKPTSSKQPKTLSESQNQNKPSKKPTSKKQPSWLEQDKEENLVAEFRELPTNFQKTLLPDLEKISLTSQKYLTRANTKMTKGFKPIVGKKYAPTIASLVSIAFIIIPLLLLSLLINHIKAYFSLQKLLISIQLYLSIYFSILCFSSLVTGLEPLRFLFATSQSTYVCVVVIQTLAYVLYLLLLLMYLILVFSTDSGLGSKLVGLGQTFVGFSVGLHFYVSVFHRVVLHQPPKTSWKLHGIYATCFFVVCLFSTVDRTKKVYLEDGGEEGKKN